MVESSASSVPGPAARLSERWSSRPWLMLLAAALLLSLGLTYRLLHTVFPFARDTLRILREEWPAVRVKGDRFELLGDVPPLKPISLPHGWRLLLDPWEDLLAEDVKPRTIVVQQGRFLLRQPNGVVRQFDWRLSPGDERIIDGRFFRKLDRLLLGGVLLVGGLLLVPCFVLVLLLASLASGLLLVLELVGLGPAPPSAFGYSALLLLPFSFAYMLTGGFGLRFARIELALAIGYLVVVALSWWFESGQARGRGVRT